MPPEEQVVAPPSSAAAGEPPPNVVAPPATAEDGSPAASDPGDAPAKPAVRDIGEFARRRAGLDRKSREVAERERAAIAREKAADTARAESDAKIAKLESQLAELTKGNPLLRPGVDPEKEVREYLEAGTPAAKVTELEKRLQAAEDARTALEKRITDAEEKRERERQEGSKAQEAAREGHALQTFAKGVTSGEAVKRYPHLNMEFTTAEVHTQAIEIHKWAKDRKWKDASGKTHNGAQYSFEEVANFLEERARQVHKSREDRRRSILTSSEQTVTAPPASAPRVKAPPGSGPRALGQSPRVVDPPVKPRVQARLSRAQQEEEDLKMLKQASAADAAERIRREKKAPAPH